MTDGAKTLPRILVVLVLLAVGAVMVRQFARDGLGTDFPHFYSAARIVASGQGHWLYDLKLQWEMQERLTGRVGNFFIHPPFEALLYLPFCFLPLTWAYAAWTVVNLLALMVAVDHEWPCLPPGPSPLWKLAACLTFVPVLLCLRQGQDSILLLLVFLVAFSALQQERPVRAGCLLALGLFKFQFVLPVALVLLAARRRGFLAGFAVTGCGLVLLSAALTGWIAFTDYAHLLLDLRHIPYSGVHPHDIANLRGICSVAFGSWPDTERIALGALTVFALATGIYVWRATPPSAPERTTLALAHTMVVGFLVSYQASPHDLTLLLIPIAVLVAHIRVSTGMSRGMRFAAWAAAAILFLPPLHVLALGAHLYYLFAIPVMLLLPLTLWQLAEPPRRQQ